MRYSQCAPPQHSITSAHQHGTTTALTQAALHPSGCTPPHARRAAACPHSLGHAYARAAVRPLLPSYNISCMHPRPYTVPAPRRPPQRGATSHCQCACSKPSPSASTVDLCRPAMPSLCTSERHVMDQQLPTAVRQRRPPPLQTAPARMGDKATVNHGKRRQVCNSADSNARGHWNRAPSPCGAIATSPSIHIMQLGNTRPGT